MEDFQQEFETHLTDDVSLSADVELLLGPYRCGKTAQMIEDLLDLKAANPLSNVLILVPSARYGRIWKDRLKTAVKLRHANAPASTNSGFFGLAVQPFYQACLAAFSKSRGEPQLIAEEIRPQILTQILTELKSAGKLSSLARIVSFHGTAASILELIDEFQRAGLSPDDLHARLEVSSCSESHLFELCLIYKQYHERLKNLGYYDQKSVALTARKDLFSANIPKPEYDLILIDGFDRISHLQAQIFAGLARRSRLTRISFDYTLAASAQASADPARPVPCTAYDGPSPNPVQQKPEDYRWKDSSYSELITNLNPKIRTFTTAEGSAPAIEAVSLLDPFLEMVEVARQIKTSLKSRNLKLNELIVVTRNPDAYNGAIESAFEDAGIPYFIDGSSRISELAPWQFIFALLSLGSSNEFRRKDLIDILRSPFINLDALSLSARDVSTLDRESYNKKLIAGFNTWKKFLSEETYSSIHTPILSFLSLLDHGNEPATAFTHANKIENIIEKYMLLPGSEYDLKSIEAFQERESIKALRRILKVLILEEKLLNHQPEPFAEFWKRFEKLADNTNYARPRPETGAVTICSAELVPNIRFKEIYICGMLEGEFPRHQRSKGFLSRDEVLQWYSFGIDIRNPRQEPGFERALFFSLAERCTEKLHLSLAQFAGKKSEETIPSFYLTELLQSTQLQLKRMRPFQEARRTPVSVRDALTQSLWDGGLEAAESLSECSEAVAFRWHNLSFSLASILSRQSLQAETLYNGYLADLFSASALSLPGQDKETWTASKINDYGKCPFRYWASHVLSIKPRDEAEAGLNFAVIGQLYHKVLELFFSRMSEQEQTPDWTKSFDTAFADSVDWLEKRGDFQPSAYWEQERKELHFRLRKFVEKEMRRLESSNFKPTHFELNFGTRAVHSYPPLLLKDNHGKEIVISGSIDRVDIELISDKIPSTNRSKRARIIDYKSGSKRISTREAELGRNLQLPIYALALEQCIMPGHTVGEGDYLSINAGASVGHINFESEKQAELKEHARQKVADYASAARSGVFTVRPNGQASCNDCNHTSVCRVKELPLQSEEDDNAFPD